MPMVTARCCATAELCSASHSIGVIQCRNMLKLGPEDAQNYIYIYRYYIHIFHSILWCLGMMLPEARMFFPPNLQFPRAEGTWNKVEPSPEYQKDFYYLLLLYTQSKFPLKEMLNLRASLHFGSLGQGLALEGAIQAIPMAMVLKVICRSAQF